MECPHCNSTNPPEAVRCVKCDAPLLGAGRKVVAQAVVTPPPELDATLNEEAAPTPKDLEGATLGGDSARTSPGAPNAAPVEPSPHGTGGASGWSAPTGGTGAYAAALAALEPGTLLGNRYEIIRQLGQGGMGAVYQARDLELDRTVALKTIRPELAGQPEILQRFKQELILARQVTHRNVIRIFDLGEAGGIKFITMEYIEGRDLKSLLVEKGKLPPAEAVAIIEQACLALEAAHREGIVHRDLKPQNIMVDGDGKVSVMDFGIARSLELGGMTQTGALLGTPEYMSPEQVQGEKVDARSDLFTLGIIFYELLTGDTPYRADTALATMFKRTKERAVPLAQLDSGVPGFLSDVVSKCLEINPELRYQSAAEILRDLETQHAPRSTRTGLRLVRLRLVETVTPRWIVPGIAAILLVIAGFVFWGRIFSGGAAKQATVQPISLAILPFRNASGDPKLDWVGPYLAETLGTDVGQSSSLRTVSPDRVQQTLHDLQLAPNSSLDAATVRLVANNIEAQNVLWGQYLKFGDQIKIDATLQDPEGDRTAALKVEAPNQDALPATVDGLAQAVREKLSLSSSVIQELTAQAFRPSSKSIPALRDYNEGLELARRRNDLEARKRFEAATQEDPGFALAYAKLSEVYSLLGYEDEAQQASDKAVELGETLPAPEKYRTAASHLRILREYPKAIEAYENLAKATPDDTDVQSALGFLCLKSGGYDKARAVYGRLLERDPKSADALFGMGQVEVMSGDLQTALDYLNRAQRIAIQFENDEQKALILHVVGIAYRKLNKPDEAMRNYQESLAISRRLGEKATMARTLNEMGQLLHNMGKPDGALKNYQDALKLRLEIGDKKGIGDTLIDLGNLYHERGDLGPAMESYRKSLQIQQDLGDEFSQAICLNNIGSVYSSRGDYQEALTFFEQALQLREKLRVPAQIAVTVYNLGDTSLRMGQFDQALSQYLSALKLYKAAGNKRYAAIASHSTAKVFEYQGRYDAALSAEREALEVFRGLQGRDLWMGEILSGYGNALSLVGRSEEAQKNLDEALSLARQIKSEPLTAEILSYQGDLASYKGNLKSARSQYEQALRIALHTSERGKALVARINLAKVTVAEGRPREAISALRALTKQADTQGLKSYSVECSVYLAQALISTKNYGGAMQELQRSLERSEKLGLRVLLAKSHFLLATALHLAGNSAEALRHYHQAARLLEEIRQEPGADKVMDRADLKSMYGEASRWLLAGKG